MSKKKNKNKLEKSSIVLDTGFSSSPKTQEKKQSLQRTHEWKMSRLGRWTGVQFKGLMTCSPAGGKLSWNDVDKIFMFSSGALKNIYENAMERKTGRYMESGEGTKEMRYGTRVEPLIQKQVKKQLKKMGVDGKVIEVGFKKFPILGSVAGVSSDSIIIDKETKTPIANIEIKACTSWGTHFERTFEAVDEKGIDFWQTQGQMIAWDVDITYYAVAEPPADILKYLYYEGDIFDLYKDFVNECEVKIQTIKASKTHQNALLKRIIIAESALSNFAKNGTHLRVALEESIKHYKENKDELKLVEK